MGIRQVYCRIIKKKVVLVEATEMNSRKSLCVIGIIRCNRWASVIGGEG